MAHQQIPKSAAQSLYPHLHSGVREPVQQRQQPTLANALYPSLSAPKAPKPPQPAPQRRRHEDETWRDWSGVDPQWARLVGLVRR
jgi:hypothetical protein